MKATLVLFLFPILISSQADTLRIYNAKKYEDSVQKTCELRIDSIARVARVALKNNQDCALGVACFDDELIGNPIRYYKIVYSHGTIIKEGEIHLKKQVGPWKEYYTTGELLHTYEFENFNKENNKTHSSPTGYVINYKKSGKEDFRYRHQR
jgi:hypothetical protein